jgi:hypothetical protein
MNHTYISVSEHICYTVVLLTTNVRVLTDHSPGRIGTDILEVSVSILNLSVVTGVLRGAPLSFQSGINSFSAIGSIQAPDNIWPPETQQKERQLLYLFLEIIKNVEV